ncbi:hypothetical protein E4U43_004852, partial [Claviceps pusilla]
TRHRGVHIRLQLNHGNGISAQELGHKREEGIDTSRNGPAHDRQEIHPPSLVDEADPAQMQETAQAQPVFRLLGLVVPQPGMVRTLCILRENSNQSPRPAHLHASLWVRDAVARSTGDSAHHGRRTTCGGRGLWKRLLDIYAAGIRTHCPRRGQYAERMEGELDLGHGHRGRRGMATEERKRKAHGPAAHLSRSGRRCGRRRRGQLYAKYGGRFPGRLHCGCGNAERERIHGLSKHDDGSVHGKGENGMGKGCADSSAELCRQGRGFVCVPTVGKWSGV